MDAFLKMDKMNRKKRNLSGSNISRNSFGSILESIRQTDNAQDDETNSQFSTPKDKVRLKNKQKPFEVTRKQNFSSIASSNLKYSTIDFTDQSKKESSGPSKQIPKREQKSQVKQEGKKPIEMEKKLSAGLILRKLEKGFETENSSKNTSSSQVDVMKTSYVNKQRIHREPLRKWGTDMRKSFATNLSQQYDSDLDFNEEDQNHDYQLFNTSNQLPLDEPVLARQLKGNERNFQQKQKTQNRPNQEVKKRSEEKPGKKLFENFMPNNKIDVLKSVQIRPRVQEDQSARLKSSIRIPLYHEQIQSISSQSQDISSLARKFREQRMEDSSLRTNITNYTKRSDKFLQTTSKNTLSMTGKAGQTTRQYIIAILQYCSHQIGLACYNNTTGQFHLCQLVENLTYFRTLSTVEIFSPLQIIYSVNFENTLLIKKLKEKFRQTSFKGVSRRFFDQQSGYNLYLKTANRQYLSSTSRFLAFSCFNTLLIHLQTSLDKVFKHQSLSVQWHRLDQLLVIEPDAVNDLQIFYNFETKKNKKCFVENFYCITFGGTRMLRANLLQPPSQEKIIVERQKLLEKLLQNPTLLDFMRKEFYSYKFYQPVTAKFVQMPKEQSFKSLKAYLSSIFMLSKQCLSLGRLYKVLEERNAFDLPIFQKLDSKLQHQKVKFLKNLIEDNFEQNMLRDFETMKNKKDKYIFLFKVQKIEDPFAAVTRQLYTQTVDTINQYFETVKRKTSEEMSLMFNDHRGFFIKVNQSVDLHKIAQRIEQNLVQISGKGKMVTFSTQILSSLNNRLKQSEHVLVLQSESLLRKIISQIQKNIDILFDINQIISTIDMIMSFANYVNKYSMIAKFHKPIFVKGINKLHIVDLKPVWLAKPQNDQSQKLEKINLHVEGDDQRVVLLQKSSNSISQSSFMYSTAYAIILSQIGCFVPATKIQLRLFDSILSKIQIEEKTEQGMSRFQMNMAKIQNIFDNCFIKNEGRSLVLMDEIARGSQHEEECALSLATIKQLQRNKGLSILTTSDRMLVQFMTFHADLKNVKIVRSMHFEQEKNAIQKIASESVDIMKNWNFDRKFIQWFDEIKIQPTYSKLKENSNPEQSDKN